LFGFPLSFLRAGRNIGFGGAVNLAIQSTNAPLLAALNDHTEPDPQWLSELLGQMQNEGGVRMCASSIRLSRSGKPDSAGLMICLDGSSKQRGGRQAVADFVTPEDVLFPSACAVPYRRELLEEVGLFDSDFFLCCEDTDVGLRAAWAGWRCRYAPRATVARCYSPTAQSYSALKARYIEGNRLWVALRNFPLPLLLMLPLVSAACYLCQLWQVLAGSGAAGEFTRSGSSLADALCIVVGTHRETIAHIPALLRKRAEIRRVRRTGDREFILPIMRHRIAVRDRARAW
jgi:GT2 family glycosyltransferase